MMEQKSPVTLKVTPRGRAWRCLGMNLVGGGCLLLLAGVVHAEDGVRAPGDFFPKNYVSGEEVEAKEEALPPTPQSNRSRNKREGQDTLVDERTGFFENEGDEGPAEPTPTPEPLVRNTNQKVLSVSGFVTGKTVGDAVMELAEAGRVLRERNIPLRHVSIVCNPLEFQAQIADTLKRLAQDPALFQGYVWMSSVLRIINEVPARYQVVASPVWLIETAQGESIIEGEGPSLEEMITPEGEFLVPTGGDEVKQLPPPPARRR